LISTDPISCPLEELGDLKIVPVNASDLSVLWNEVITRHHYLGQASLVGAQKRYLIYSQKGFLGALSFSAAAWAVKSRDDWIGWSSKARQAHLSRVVSNSRFLILPWVRVPHLASKILSLVLKRLPRDWQEAYGYEPLLVETYVDREKFKGTCYKAAGWVEVGSTSGRGKRDRQHAAPLPIKKIFVYPLRDDFRAILCQEPISRFPVSSDWAEEEFGEVSLGDDRLGRRLLALAHDFYARPEANIPQACGSRAKTKAAYRFLDHPGVKMEEILKPHYEATAARCAREKIVLALQDTTSFNYSTHRETEGLGLIGSDVDGSVGMLLHETLTVNTEGVSLGLLDAQCWVRDPATFGKKEKRLDLPIEEKESFKWLKSFRAVASFQKRMPQTTLVSVGDREADVYDLFQLAISYPAHPKLLIRAERDRALADGQGHLWEFLEKQPVAGIQEIGLPRRKGQRARVVRLAVSFSKVTLIPPRKKNKSHLRPLEVFAVLAREEAVPDGVEPIEWMLVTTLPVTTLEAAVEKLRWYGLRWQIEVYHKVLKSGIRIEQRQLGNTERIENCLAIDLVVAWRILHLTRLGRQTPDVPCTVAFEDYEWKALMSFVKRTPTAPETPPTLREAIRTVASLGGFLGRKGDGEPGTQTLWLGLQRLDDIAASWQIFVGSRWTPDDRSTSPVSSKVDYG
jgi:hypothetical protein